MTTAALPPPALALQPLLEPRTLALRPYQRPAIDDVRAALAAGHRRVILCAPTGSGKGEMAIHLIERARAKGSRVGVVADRRILVDQFGDRLRQYGIPHGVVMADKTAGRAEPIQVCSAQTIEKRGWWDDLDLLIVDEAHVQRKKTIEFAKAWGGPTIGLTATPITAGLSAHWEHVVNATTTDQLLADGWLAPLRIYAAREIDMTGAKKTAGEWQHGEVRRRGGVIIGDIVSTWVQKTHELFGGPVKTLVFSADVAHGAELCQAFQIAGHDFRQSSYRDDDAATQRVVEGFRRGEFTGLVSVEKFVKGFDVPDVLCMIGARPYSKSLAAVLQQLGRGMRIAPGKDFCAYLDHAGNMAGWYDDICDFWASGVERLPQGPQTAARSEGETRRADVVCPSCALVLPPGGAACPGCGAARPQRRTRATAVDGRLEELTRDPGDWRANPQWTWRQICRIALDRKRGDHDAARSFAYAQFRAMYDRWPSGDFLPANDPPDPRVARAVQHQLIRYAKSKR